MCVMIHYTWPVFSLEGKNLLGPFFCVNVKLLLRRWMPSCQLRRRGTRSTKTSATSMNWKPRIVLKPSWLFYRWSQVRWFHFEGVERPAKSSCVLCIRPCGSLHPSATDLQLLTAAEVPSRHTAGEPVKPVSSYIEQADLTSIIS